MDAAIRAICDVSSYNEVKPIVVILATVFAAYILIDSVLSSVLIVQKAMK